MQKQLWFGEAVPRELKTGRKVGKWRINWRYIDPSTTLEVKVDKLFDSRREAIDWRDDMKVKLRTGGMIAAVVGRKAETLNAWFDRLAGTKERGFAGLWKEDGTQPQTIAVRVSRYNSHVRQTWLGQLPVQKIDLDLARRWFLEFRASGVSDATVHEVRRLLVLVANDAVDTYERFPDWRAPFRKIKIPAMVLREGVILSPEDAKKAMKRLEKVEDRAWLGALLLTGFRLGEHMALTRMQVDYAASVILCNSSVIIQPGGAQTLGLPKGDKVRIVAMCPTLSSLLRDGSGDSEYVFGTVSGGVAKPVMKKVWYARWQKIKKDAQLPTNMQPRDCRLSHNTWIEKFMVEKVSISTRLEHMGHSLVRGSSDPKGISVNVQNYTRHIPEGYDVLRAELERLVGL